MNTHTTQIDNLNKELDRVKKLEESTVSTVTTDSSFTTVTETTQGYFEDVKIEGKTLVNLAIQPTNNGHINTQYASISKAMYIKPSTEYTYIIRNNGSEMVKLYLNSSYCFTWTSVDVEANSTVIGKAESLPTINGDIWLSLRETETVKQNLQTVLLEGDHTDKDITFFEGLKSVGQDNDEISVSSVNENLLDLTTVNQDWGVGKFDTIESTTDITYHSCVAFDVESYRGKRIYPSIFRNDVCLANYVNYLIFFNENKEVINRRYGHKSGNANIDEYIDLTQGIVIPHNAKYCRLMHSVGEGTLTNGYIQSDKYIITLHPVVIGEILLTHKSNKKQILYYNPTTQTWEKPVLREWDSIEKHSDGKYYYHKRSGEVVFNGSESWQVSGRSFIDYKSFYLTDNEVNVARGSFYVCDRFNYNRMGYYNTEEGEYIGNNSDVNTPFIIINIANSKLSTQNVAGFKAWLQANPTTVVYQLAQEEVYACTNLDLITYPNETNLIVNSGAIQPRITLKVLSNVSNVVKLLQEKVYILENKFIEGLKQVLSGNMMALAQLLYPEDFENNHEIQTLEL